ncbi:hypothetical protein ACSZNL_11670 [Aeromonas jandaei]
MLRYQAADAPRKHLFMLITAADRALLSGHHGRQAGRTDKANCLTSATERKFKSIYLQQSES